MGGSLVDAVDKRRAGVDLSPVPEKLKPVLERMLVPDPKQRIRSMDDVVAMLDGAGMGNRPPEVIIEQRGPSRGVLIGARSVCWRWPGARLVRDELRPQPEEQVRVARTAVEQALPGVECSWLNVVGVQAGEPLSVRMAGVAGNPTAARNQITQAITQAGIGAANVTLTRSRSFGRRAARRCRPSARSAPMRGRTCRSHSANLKLCASRTVRPFRAR
jgi:serine/threonine-protein kinase